MTTDVFDLSTTKNAFERGYYTDLLLQARMAFTPYSGIRSSPNTEGERVEREREKGRESVWCRICNKLIVKLFLNRGGQYIVIIVYRDIKSPQ